MLFTNITHFYAGYGLNINIFTYTNIFIFKKMNHEILHRRFEITVNTSIYYSMFSGSRVAQILTISVKKYTAAAYTSIAQLLPLQPFIRMKLHRNKALSLFLRHVACWSAE